MKIEVLEVIENEDGTCNVIFDYDDEFVDLVKKELNQEEVSEEEISLFIADAIEKGIVSFKEE